MSIAAAIAVAYMIHRWGTARMLPSDLALTSALEFHRLQLERQRDLVRTVWWWYLLPFTPGVLVLELGHALAQPERRVQIVFGSVVMFLVMVGIYVLNRRAAARIQRQIDRLTENLSTGHHERSSHRSRDLADVRLSTHRLRPCRRTSPSARSSSSGSIVSQVRSV